MTVIIKTNPNLTTSRVIRDDAVKYRDRYIVPTSDATKWVATWAEAQAAGLNICWNEDQTEIELLLPEPYKFSIQFPSADPERHRSAVTLEPYVSGDDGELSRKQFLFAVATRILDDLGLSHNLEGARIDG